MSGIHYHLEPQVPGRFAIGAVVDRSTTPPSVRNLKTFILEYFPSDDLLQKFPCYFVATRLKSALETVEMSGYSFAAIEVAKDEQWQVLYPDDRPTPEIWRFVVTGQAGRDDFGLTADHRADLVVSERALSLLKQFELSDCHISPWAAT